MGVMMLGRLFGRGKDERSEAMCAVCGRTLLAGEWTQRVTDDRGEEVLLCSLCGQTTVEGERLKVRSGSAAAVRRDPDDAGSGGDVPIAEAPRDENAALWKAIKDRDAEIERLTAQLAHAEAERQELVGMVAQLKRQLEGAPSGEDGDAAVVAEVAPVKDDQLFDHERAGEAAAGMFEAASMADEPTDRGEPGPEAEAFAVESAGEAAAVETLATEQWPASPEDTAEITAEEAAAEGLAIREDASVESAAPAPDEASVDAEADVEAEAASLTLLQRGVDLLNVSTVPRKVAETTAELGLPSVHVAFDGQVVTATFLWNMGWYRYTVELESGAVRLDHRGYEERDDLRPNGTVRGDGTVQLAPAQISRAAAQRLQQPRPPQPDETDNQPAPPPTGPEILSKSLLGQRTDDEPSSWEQTRARDFTWD